ncbi:MAG: biopolymer transporter ExbD [Proteobacteria bacterium]|nr:biopolymer transporter ExbD [Pseudomonadota bacterium]
MKSRINRQVLRPAKPRVEVIPMIDIMMFLLVFFVIVAMKMIDGTGVAMEIPGSRTTEAIQNSTLTIGVDQGGIIVIDGSEILPADLTAKLVNLKKDGNLDIIIAGDKETSLQQLISLMDIIRGAGINSVAIAARADKTK